MTNVKNDDDDDYPLNCIDDTGDGFSGWFAISNPRTCNDFCYWEIVTPTRPTPSALSPSSVGGVQDESNSTAAAAAAAGGEQEVSGDSTYNSWNTANPHVSSVIYYPQNNNNETNASPIAYWTCLFDVADDKITVANAGNGQRWIDAWQYYDSPSSTTTTSTTKIGGGAPIAVTNDIPFPYLRCQKGAGEQLTTWSSEAIKSATFWQGWIVIITLIFSGEILIILVWMIRKRRIVARYAQVGVLEDQEDAVGVVGIVGVGAAPVRIVEESWRDNHRVQPEWMPTTTRCKYCAPCSFRRRLSTQYIIRTLLLLLCNLLLTITLSFVSLSLMELRSNPHFTERMQVLTPACSDPTLVCPAGNDDIDRPSVMHSSRHLKDGFRRMEKETGDATLTTIAATTVHATSSTSPNHQNQHDMEPFSYIIASDAQLYWFNGEFSEMGEKPIPSSCSPSDSCGRCTAKHGLNTNLRLKNAWEGLMLGRTDGMRKRRQNATISSTSRIDGDHLPIPNTLIMNGDLTAYFHPWEKKAYDDIYHSINGLQYYFPSLGNHDIEHPGGAMYGGDEWAVGGPPNCNMEHAIGYFKSGFCGSIPAFQPDRIVRYDSSSLAYSWDQGRYHFVHLHYYPTYEMASVNYHSSLKWLERDLQLAYDAGMATVLFVHAVQGLNEAMETIILGKNVRAIIAGHTHRCLATKCEGLRPLNVNQMEYLDSLGIAIDKCVPAAYDTCQVLTGENMIYVKDLKYDIAVQKKRLENKERTEKPLCPKPAPFYINETDNTLLCRRTVYSQPTFPFETNDKLAGETIPVFWSGSSSFETFLRGDFYDDRIVINALTVSSEDGEAVIYVDEHDVPNAVYPYHEVADIEEIVIYI